MSRHILIVLLLATEVALAAKKPEAKHVTAAAEKKTPPSIIKLAPGGEPRGECDVCSGVEHGQQTGHICGIVR